MKLDNETKEAMGTCGIPEYMHGAIIAFYEDGWPPGDFLNAVINNDLRGAVIRADDKNINRLKNYVLWFYNNAPSGTWGFAGAVKKWCDRFRESVPA